MMTVNDVSKRTGVSIRTLQYYDRIGLLKATAYSEAGYRFYDQEALARLQQILLFRELEFPLKDIREILSSPGFDRTKALKQQIELLELKKAHIEALITLARGITETGEQAMDFSAFDKTRLEDYASQAKAQWGGTQPYAEYQEKSAGRTAGEEQALGQGLLAIFAELGKIRHTDPAGPAAQALVKELQDYITANCYRCTDQILLSLGGLYAAGGEFTENIDAAGGPGTAEFACKAIRAHCAG